MPKLHAPQRRSNRLFAAHVAFAGILSIPGCGGSSVQPRYAISIEKSSFKYSFMSDATASVIRVSNNEKHPVAIERILINGEYQIDKRWATDTPITCSFPLTLEAGKSEQFYVTGSMPRTPFAISPKLEKKRREATAELWKGFDQPMQFVEVVTDRGSQMSYWDGNISTK